MSKKDFENMSPKEIEDYFGVTQEQIEEWDDMLVRGEIPGVSVGEVVVGRPSLRKRTRNRKTAGRPAAPKAEPLTTAKEDDDGEDSARGR